MTRRLEAEYQGPRIRAAGMVRDRPMPPDARVACADPLYVGLFAKVIDITVATDGARSRDKKYAQARIDAAKEICADCPVRLKCLETHGPDLTLGVVGGLTDAERATIWPKTSRVFT